MNEVYVHPYNYDGEAINTTSRSKTWSKGLSPFYLGPVNLFGGLVAQNVENAWQYLKVYEEDTDAFGNPSRSYYKWAREGFKQTRANRYPKGKGRKPLYSYWDGQHLTYVEARKKIYCPLYSAVVEKTEAYQKLQGLFAEGNLHLRDFDGYDHHAAGMSFEEVLNCETRKMGHAFVLAMMLTNQRVWENYQ